MIFTSIILPLLILLVVLVGANYTAPWLLRWYQVRSWNKRSGEIALTYDDGPDNTTSVALLDLLDELNVRATFYLVGFRADLCPEVVTRLARSHHQLGSHSHNHLHPWKVAPWVEAKDAAAGIRTLRNLLPVEAAYRPPFGKISLATMIMLWLKGSRVHWWCFDTKDTNEILPDPRHIAEAIIVSGKPVVLMHCHHPEQSKREFMLELTRLIVFYARARNLRLVTMDELDSSH